MTFKTIVVGLLVTFLLIYLADKLVPKDSTDSPDSRSGLSVRTDSLTGCQYLTVYEGGLYPRMNKEGNQICKD